MDPDANRLRTILDALYDTHRRAAPDRAGDSILGVLIRTILSQATSASNSRQAFRQLLEAFGGDWRLVAEARVEDVGAAIAVGGLSRQKAPRIQAILARIHQDFGAYSLESLRGWEPERARTYLAGFVGVGPKTAAFTLMVAAGMDVFSMNGGVLRVCHRLGFLDGNESDETAHRKMGGLVPAGEAYPAHIALVRHARGVCRARNPRCGTCPIRACCPRNGVVEEG